MKNSDNKTKILFVCHGNICRSVGAEYILRQMATENGTADHFVIDSAATSTEEIGNGIYPPMKAALNRRHVKLGGHRARQITPADYDKYDLIIGMDEENMAVMHRRFDGDPDGKIHYLMAYTDHPDEIIDDPWYTRDFDGCIDQLEKGCAGLMDYLEKE